MSWRVETALAVLLAMLLGAAALLGRRHRVASVSRDPRASSLLTGPLGSQGVYDALAAMGRLEERRRLPLFDVARPGRHRPGLLLVLDPPLPLAPAELDDVAAYLQDGGAVLAAGNGGGLTRCAGWLARDTVTFAADSAPVRPPGVVLPRVVAWLVPDTMWRAVRRRADLAREAPRCAGLRDPAAVDTLLVLRDGRPVILRLRGEGAAGRGGSLTLLADPGYLRNVVWKRTAAPGFVLPLLTPPERGRLVWDEYHQGFGREGSLTGATWAWLVHTPLGWAILQLCAVSLVALAVAAVRFGPARAVLERRRRSPLEHVEALAAGLEGAGGADTAVALAVSGLRRRLSRAGQAPGADPGPWLAALELALPGKRGRDAVRRLRDLVSEPGGAERALAAAQAVEDVWEELRPRTKRAAS